MKKMAQQQTQQASKKNAGRPAKVSPEQRAAHALENLQATLDRACGLVHDNPTTSYAVKARRAKKAGIPRATLEAGLDALGAALDDARGYISRLYSEKEKVVQARRVTLG